MDAGPQHGLLSEITTITETVRTGVTAVLDSPGWSLTDTEVRDAVEALWRARAQVEAAFLHTVRILDDRPDALGGAGKAKVAATFLVGRLHVDPATASSDVRAAHALDPDTGALAAMGSALAAGLVSRQHVDVAVTAVAKLPKAALTQHLPTTGPERPDDTHDAHDAHDTHDTDPTGDTGDTARTADGVTLGDADSDDAGAAAGTGAGGGMTGAEFVDRWLAHHARRESPRMLRAMAKGLRDRIDPDHDDRSFDPDAHLKRSLTLRTDRFTGLATLNARLTAPDAAALAAFLRSATKPTPPVETVREEPDGTLTTVQVSDTRSMDMRRYDALMGLFRAAHTNTGSRTRSTASSTTSSTARTATAEGPVDTVDTVDTAAAADDETGTGSGTLRTDGTVPARLLVTATVEQIAAATTLAAAKNRVGAAGLTRGHAWDMHLPPVFAAAGRAHLDRVGHVDPHLLAYLSCTAAVQRLLLDPNGQPLHLGRAARLASGSQRHAAAVRDGGCVIPYCSCPAEDTDLHHLTHWALGGPTDLSNLVSLCGRHHQETHAGTWRIEIRDGIVWVQPPPWIDPEQRWLRAPARTRAESVQHAAEQLRLHLDDAA